MSDSIFLDLDGAWGDAVDAMPRRNLRAWGPRLRYCAPRAEVEAFDVELGELPPYILYGSGDYHFLAGMWVRRMKSAANRTGLALVSFDNHPDWDIRPPHWACGGWISRALEMPHVASADVWGCGNFELAWPSRLFANHAALRDGRLTVHPWAERQKPAVQRRFDCMTRSDWRERFAGFANRLAGRNIYVTVDLDSLSEAQAVTNWENGLFKAGDVAWAIGQLRNAGSVVGGDLCGAWSEPAYARWGQRFAGNWDHPRLPPRDPGRARQLNRAALNEIWPVLIGAADVR